ncbi:MAG: TIM44-like domain-containing protein [Candidatus Rokubacteria bacterium]|nr:TIM44-like domain-containing protein [Candidatus Rokubacteria bacterium]
MKRRALLSMVAVVMTAWFVTQADDAWARARFGGGSRGGRSYSAPARPATPAMPSVPSSPSRSVTKPAAPAASPAKPAGPRPSFFVNFTSGAAGFMLGGLLGRMVFGAGMGGGIGLVELALVGLGVYLFLSLFRHKEASARPAYAVAGAPPARVGAVVTPEPAARQPMQPFDRAGLADATRALYSGVRSGLAMRDMGMFRNRLTPKVYGALQAWCDRLKSAKQSNHVEKLDLAQAEVTDAWRQGEHEYAVVRLAGSLLDYTLDDASDSVVDGSKETPRDFAESWTFTRPAGSQAWKLAAIQTA